MKAIEEEAPPPSPPPRARRKKRRPVTTSSEEDEPIVPLRKRKTERTLRGRVKPKFDAETLEPVAEAPTMPEFKGDPFADENPTGHFNPRYAKGATGPLMKRAVELYKSTRGLNPGEKASLPALRSWNTQHHASMKKLIQNSDLSPEARARLQKSLASKEPGYDPKDDSSYWHAMRLALKARATIPPAKRVEVERFT